MNDIVHRELSTSASHLPTHAAPAPSVRPKTFSFTRRFTVLTCACIALASMASAAYLSRLMAEKTIHHDAKEVMQFVQSFTPPSIALDYFEHSDGYDARSETMAPLLDRIAAMPDVVHVNVYNRHHKVLWSTRPEMVGKVLPINSELEEALNGELAVESSILEDNNYLKPEHVYLKTKENFVETYVPIWAEDQFRVLGVIEIYRRPTALFALTHDLIRGVWLSALASAIFLFATLYWLARRANRTMHAQHRQLVDAEKLAAVGEISAAIAHSIRNPLATIRSTAELAQEIDPHTMHEPATDIVKQVDRIVFLINQLLTYAQPAGLNLTRVDAMAILREVLESFAPTLTRQHINVQAPESAPSLVKGDRTMISQVFNSLIANAIEAMPKGGNIAVSVTTSSDRSRLSIIIADTGEGIPPEHMRRLFIPFNTTKKSGLGVGLPLVRSALNRMSGSIDIASTLGSGTRVQIQLPAA